LLDDIYHNQKLAHPMVVINDIRADAKQAYGYAYNYGTAKKKKKDRREVTIS